MLEGKTDGAWRGRLDLETVLQCGDEGQIGPHGSRGQQLTLSWRRRFIQYSLAPGRFLRQAWQGSCTVGAIAGLGDDDREA